MHHPLGWFFRIKTNAVYNFIEKTLINTADCILERESCTFSPYSLLMSQTTVRVKKTESILGLIHFNTVLIMVF